MISSIIFTIIFIGSASFFYVNAVKIRRNIFIGKNFPITDNKGERLKTMVLVALGQSKMLTRPISAVMHILVYVGFVLINIEVLEMFVDGLTNSHRAFAFLGGFYNFLIAFFEILALGVFIGVVVFWLRRNVMKVKRFWNSELKGFPSLDANAILITEMILMTALMLMNAADQNLQLRGNEHYHQAGSFPISGFFAPMLSGMSDGSLILIERVCWWLHIIGIFAFLNYLPYSKHLHILLAFPNTYFSNLKPKGQFNTLDAVTDVVAPNFDPAYVAKTDPNNPVRFGVKDVQDLGWKNLMDAYSCTECGRCTSACPQNMTGKKLSPRKIMMDTRDRMEEVGRNMDKNQGVFVDDGKSLLGDYTTAEEVWACNTCNACVQECPINIDPLAIIIEMRRYLVMEESQSPSELNGMFTNIENNGAPWQFAQADRANWVTES
ncbi:4Fe-4S dicluster domain-containing protein [Aurantibacillus circumpalustris]|uniref:4Fe-4S dicluster domain-containing protein n=1 Tax=Aurantibacillus circumpalustris TaxID=3036359 RepID=UPI00295AFD49|nr:4Fe-4S dicluster domain-containing protein [Aurantibacillus circumpalustris]